MKMTIKKKYLLFAAAALTLAACSNDDENLNGGPVELRLSSGIEVQEVTRAATDIQNEAFDANESMKRQRALPVQTIPSLWSIPRQRQAIA